MFARLGRGKRETALLTLHLASCQASCPFFSASCCHPFPWVARSPAFLPSASLGCHLAPPSPFQHGGACISPRHVSNWKSTEKENSIKLNFFFFFFMLAGNIKRQSVLRVKLQHMQIACTSESSLQSGTHGDKITQNRETDADFHA